MNDRMPRVHGDSFIHIDDIDFLLPHDEPLLEYSPESNLGITKRIGDNIARLVEDGDTIQVGYGAVTNAILENLSGKKHLGVHTELFNDGIVELMKKGVIDNTKKTINRGKSVATFCMGHKGTYDFIHDNPDIEFRTIDYTNNPLVIAQHENMVAINSALEIDLTGQATAESIGKVFYSGIGGQADFMRGAREKGIMNLSIVRKRWEDVNSKSDLDGPYDLVIARHSLGMPNIRDAVKAMCEASSEWVYLFWFAGSTGWERAMIDLWPKLHGREYRSGPKADILYNVLYSMGIYPNVETVQMEYTRKFPDINVAINEFREQYMISSPAQEEILRRASPNRASRKPARAW